MFKIFVFALLYFALSGCLTVYQFIYFFQGKSQEKNKAGMPVMSNMAYSGITSSV